MFGLKECHSNWICLHGACSLLNRISTKDNLVRRGIVSSDDCHCVRGCVLDEERNHLFVRCNHFGRIWNMVSAWSGFEFVGNDLLQEQQNHFCALGGRSKRDCCTMAMLWAATTWSIWKDRNCRIFQQRVEPLQTLLERKNFNFFICYQFLFYINKQIWINYIIWTVYVIKLDTHCGTGGVHAW